MIAVGLCYYITINSTTMRAKRFKQLLIDCLQLIELRENDFPVIDSNGYTNVPIQRNGVVVDNKRYEGYPRDYRGIAVEINDHGNVTLLRCYKNGKTLELASMV